MLAASPLERFLNDLPLRVLVSTVANKNAQVRLITFLNALVATAAYAERLKRRALPGKNALLPGGAA